MKPKILSPAVQFLLLDIRYILICLGLNQNVSISFWTYFSVILTDEIT